jgi:8-oxo-dGTP pyrophosphatase MutT (NUDIX family)
MAGPDAAVARPQGIARRGVSDDWPALAAATRRSVRRVPFLIDGQAVGSVAAMHVDALRRWPHWLAADDAGVRLFAPDRDAALADINTALRRQGLIVAWRDETYAIVDRFGAPPLALIERAAARFWGTLTFGAHANGYVADAQGRPTHLWIARRALTKATDPGKLDNLIGGGVPFGQTPRQTLLREGMEEAGLDAAVTQGATPGSVVELACDIAEGFMYEQIHCFDLCLPHGLTPVNQDGEVAEVNLLPVAQALALAGGDEMTTDASLVTLDFALRHKLLAPSRHTRLAPQLTAIISAARV